MSEKIFLYKEFCDENAYGSEIIELYPSREEAVARLKERVSEGFGVPFEEVPETVGLDENDTFREDYVSIDNGDGATSFWVVEEKSVQDKKPAPVFTGGNSTESMKKMFSVYGYNTSDGELTGCNVFSSHADAVGNIRNIMAEVLRGDTPEADFSNEVILDVAQAEGRYLEEEGSDIYSTDHLVYCIEPVFISKENFEKAASTGSLLKMKSLEIGKLLTISTAHISRETADLLDLAVKDDTELSLPVVFMKGEYGYVVHISEELTGDREADRKLYSDTPDDLYACQKLALENGCDWLVLDCDGNYADELPVYSW